MTKDTSFNSSNNSSNNISNSYQRITDQIVTAIEAGAGNWKMPWHSDGTDITRPINAASGTAYRGVNVIALWATAQAGGYSGGQ